MSQEAARDRAAPWLHGDRLTEADMQTGQEHAEEEADTTSPALAARAQGVCEGTKMRGWARQSPEWLSQAGGSQGTGQGRECWGMAQAGPSWEGYWHHPGTLGRSTWGTGMQETQLTPGNSTLPHPDPGQSWERCSWHITGSQITKLLSRQAHPSR